MLYFCQPSFFARALTGLLRTIDKPVPVELADSHHRAKVERFAADVLAAAPADTRVFLARLRYRIHVGSTTYITYMVLCGAALIACIVALLLGSLPGFAGRVPDTSAFAAWDVEAHYDVNRHQLDRADKSAGCMPPKPTSSQQLKGKMLIRTVAGMKLGSRLSHFLNEW